jgi:hypothetical protein
VKLSYPTTRKIAPFTEILSTSLCEESTRRLWCDGCADYQPVKQSRILRRLPHILSIHANVQTDADLDLWRSLSEAPPKAGGTSSSSSTDDDRAWLPHMIKIELIDGKSIVTRLTSSQARDVSITEYDQRIGTSTSQMSSSDQRRTSEEEPVKESPKKASSRRESKGYSSAEMRLDDYEFGSGINSDDSGIYVLTAIISHISDPPEKDSALHSVNGEHLVSHIRVPRMYFVSPWPPPASHIGSAPVSRSQSPAVSPKLSSISSSSSSHSILSSTSLADVPEMMETLPPSAISPASSSPPPHSSSSSSSSQPGYVSYQPSSEAVYGDTWVAFNDFVIHPSTSSEAVRYNGYLWKQPCLLTYTRVDLPRRFPLPLDRGTISSAVFHHTESLSLAALTAGSAPAHLLPHATPIPHPRHVASLPPPVKLAKTFVPLTPAERIGKGYLVAIDCEFVAVELEEKDVLDDGSEMVIKPARLTLGRVSCVRGEGSQTNVPFIDDYILTYVIISFVLSFLLILSCYAMIECFWVIVVGVIGLNQW